MKISLTEWDEKIAPRLQALEYSGLRIAEHAAMVQRAASFPCRPAWDTLARDALNKAEEQLRVALAVVKAAQEQYDNAPVMYEAAE